MYVFFMRGGTQYRTDFDCKVVEQYVAGNTWKRVYTGRLIRDAHMAVDEWLKSVKEGGKQ